MKKLLVFILVTVFAFQIYLPVKAEESTAKKVVACVGDSITEGYGVQNPQAESYPALLQQVLGTGYDVQNFGVSKYSALKSAKFPYTGHDKYKLSLNSKPDIVVIMLGTNDIKTENWSTGKAEFKKDYTELINSYKKLPTAPRIFVAAPPCIFLPAGDPVRPPETLANEAIPMIKEIAKETDSEFIDVYSLSLTIADHFPDKIHPDKEAAGAIAKLVGDGIQGKKAADTSGASSWAISGITAMWDKKLADESMFEEYQKLLTREEFAMLMVNYYAMNNVEKTAEGKSSFEDTGDSKYIEKIEIAYRLGIIKGVNEKEFNPEGAITRQETSVMLYGTLKLLNRVELSYVVKENKFKDASAIEEWAKEAVNYLYDKSIMKGTDELTISPKAPITREEMLVLVSRLVS